MAAPGCLLAIDVSTIPGAFPSGVDSATVGPTSPSCASASWHSCRAACNPVWAVSIAAPPAARARSASKPAACVSNGSSLSPPPPPPPLEPCAAPATGCMPATGCSRASFAVASACRLAFTTWDLAACGWQMCAKVHKQIQVPHLGQLWGTAGTAGAEAQEVWWRWQHCAFDQPPTSVTTPACAISTNWVQVELSARQKERSGALAASMQGVGVSTAASAASHR